MVATETATSEPGGSDAGRPVGPVWWWAAVAFIALVAADAAVYAFIRRHGVSSTGDEPHYLVVARAVDHLTVHPLAAYIADLRTHRLFAWAPGTPPTNLILQLYTGPHGPVSTHPIGLSVLLAPFVAFGGAPLGRLAMMAFNAAGFVYIFVRGSRLAGLGRTGRVVAAVVLAAPALWVAATQIYPDLLSGVLLGCAAVDLIDLERRGRFGVGAAIVTAASLAVVPWLHQQNLVAAAFLLAGFVAAGLVVVGLRGSRPAAREERGRPAVGTPAGLSSPHAVSILVVASVSVASWLVLLGFNQVEYGHLLGLPQPFPSLNSAGVTEILGLLFDRHQGLFAQMPLAVLGLVGMWWSGRRTAVSAAATLAAAGSLLYLNGTFIHAPYGGVSFAGRFQWSSLVPLLVWCPLAVAAIGRTTARLRLLGAAAAALWVLQAVPILLGRHAWYNQLAAGAPWDPAAYPGWWGRVDRLLPVMIPGGRLLGRPVFALLTEVLILGAMAALAVTATRPGRAPARVAPAAFLAVAAGAVALTAAAPLPLPSRPLVFPGPDLGSPYITGASVAEPALPLQALQPGTYSVTVRYTLGGAAASAVLAPYCAFRGGPPTGTTSPRTAPRLTLDPGSHSASVTLRCPSATLWFGADVGPATSLTVHDVQLAKTAAR